MSELITDQGPLTEITQLIYREARLLETERLDEWLDLLSDDCQVLIPVGKSTTPGEHDLAMIREDKFRTEARVWRVQQTGLNHSQDPPSRQVRSVSNVEIEPAGDGEFTVHFVGCLYIWRADSQRTEAQHVIPMRCQYGVRRVDEGWRITSRQLNLLQRDGLLPPMTFVL